MYTLVIAVDGSTPSLRAIGHAITLHDEGTNLSLHIINVQSDEKTTSLKSIQERGLKVLSSACQALIDTKIPYKSEVLLGPVVLSILNYADVHGCDSIMMGTRGMGPFRNAIWGSVASQVVHLSERPVTLVT